MKTLPQVHGWCAVPPPPFDSAQGRLSSSAWRGEDEGGVPTFVVNEKEKN
jgi:hypothetical protein